jgi:peptidoglycan/xylan/chitin deacetylase (PgdA/CDA1 family)
MLTYSVTKYIFLVLIIALIITNQFVPVPLWGYLLLALILISVLFYGSAFIRSGFHITAICKGDPSGNEVTLTFDDGPVEGNTGKVLEILKKNEIYATFFCIGQRMHQHPELLRQIDEQGHLIGNHSYTHHFFFDLFSKKRMAAELEQTNKEAEQITGKKISFFRPPYGVTTPVLAKVIRTANFKTIGWSVRSLDTVIRDHAKLAERVAGSVKPGDIVLLHDTSDVTVSGLQELIDSIRKKGLTFVRLDQLIKTEAYV